MSLHLYVRKLFLTGIVSLSAVFSCVGGDSPFNLWPIKVSHPEPEGMGRDLWLGPLVEDNRSTGETWTAFRPFFLHREFTGECLSVNESEAWLYPLFQRKKSDTHSEWNIFHLIRSRKVTERPLESFETDLIRYYSKSFEVFPFWFDHRASNPDDSYFGILPLYGELKNRLFYDRISWLMFPLWVKFEDNGENTRSVLWPIFKHREGSGSSGFGVWPVYGHFKNDGHYDDRYAIWPLMYHQRKWDGDLLKLEKLGVLPFYSMESRPETGYVSENYLWPFFGHTHSDTPSYEELRLFWPIFIRGRGDYRTIDQVAPFYSHSIKSGNESLWLMWPLLNLKEWQNGRLDIWRLKILYFLYWDMRQTEAGNPGNKIAQKSHLWPIYSYWEQGDTITQFQLLSPLEPLFPHNEEIRRLYSPLFALFRYSRSGDDQREIDFLFSLVHYEKNASSKQFHLGPLYGHESRNGYSRWSILRGLFGREKAGDQSRIHWFWFRTKSLDPEHGSSNALDADPEGASNITPSK